MKKFNDFLPQNDVPDEASVKRTALNEFSSASGQWDAAKLARHFPDCGCETAAPGDGHHGAVLDDENLRFFVVSRFQYDLKRKPKVTSAIFGKMFTSGFSVYRLGRANPDEINCAAKLLHSKAVEKDEKFGGIVGVVDFVASSARIDQEDPSQRLACVVETPLEGRASHADLISFIDVGEEEQRTAIKAKLFNQLQVGKFKRSGEITDMDITVYHPASLTAPA